MVIARGQTEWKMGSCYSKGTELLSLKIKKVLEICHTISCLQLLILHCNLKNVLRVDLMLCVFYHHKRRKQWLKLNTTLNVHICKILAQLNNQGFMDHQHILMMKNIMTATTTEPSLQVRHCAKCFTSFRPFSLPCKNYEVVIINIILNMKKIGLSKID